MKKTCAGIGVLLVLLAPRAVQAQDQSPDQSKMFVRALLAATAGAGPGAVFGATLGVRTGKKLQILGEAGRMMNIMPASVADKIDVAAALVADSRGGKGSSRATASANYGLAGFRVRLRDLKDAQTFTEFAVGAANVRSHVSAQIRGSETLQGDISSLVSTPFTTTGPQTKAMAAVGGGVILGVTRTTAVEMGYRYVRIMTKNPAISMSKIFGGVRIGF